MLYYHLYRIRVGNQLYIGTCQNYELRQYGHNKCAMEGSNIKVYVAMRTHGIDNCVFELIRTFWCNNNREARMQEQAEINTIPAELRLNSIKAYRSRQEMLIHNANNIRIRRLDPAYKEHERRYRQLPHARQKQVEYDKRPEVLERKKLHMRKVREDAKIRV